MRILDTTIRDGSYAIDFKFSCKDVKQLVSKSSRLGIKYIEVGHGMGLGASRSSKGIALQTDEEYIDAACSCRGDSKIGVFCIPGIAETSDIVSAVECGLNFIRIGITISDYESAIPYIEKAKEHGLFVFANFMKSYAFSPKEFSETAYDAVKKGADCVYIVDSAGSMLEKELNQYIKAIQYLVDCPLGFHGHNNLGLAISNSVYCAMNGVEYIDCTYQGLGRSLGNAPLEQFVMTMERMGFDTGIDLPCALEYGYSGLRGITNKELINPLEYICGFCGFHSGFLNDLYKFSYQRRVDPLRLIMAYSRFNKLSLDFDLLEKVSDELPRDDEDNPYPFTDFFSE